MVLIDSADFLGSNEPINSMIRTWIAVYFLHHVNLISFSAIDTRHFARDILRASRGEDINDQEVKVNLPFNAYVKQAIYLCTTPRGIDTAYQVTPRLRASETRITFLLRNLAIVIREYFILDLLTSLVFFSAPKKRFLVGRSEYFNDIGHITGRGILINRGIAVFNMVSKSVWFMDMYYRIASMLFVGLRLSRPYQWPPLFGSIKEAYTVRRFWRDYWFQSFRWPVAGIAKVFLSQFVCWPFESDGKRLLYLIARFTIIAGYYWGLEEYLGFFYPHSRIWLFLLCQPIGIIIEDAVEVLYRVVRVRCRYNSTREGTLQHSAMKILGYLWVVGFFYMTLPLDKIPIVIRTELAKDGVPISVIRFVYGYMTGHS
ncbi:hypothetical protein BJX64DRAFT_286399 [Aspergillus heterothallicus]